MPVAVREIPVTIYLNNEYIGYGSVCYVDESAVQLVDTVRYRCVKQWLCIDNYCYNDVVELCYEDKVSSFLGGLDVKTLKVNVYDAEGNAVGDAVLNLYDSYSLSIVWVLLNLAFLWAQIIALLAIVAFIRKEK